MPANENEIETFRQRINKDRDPTAARRYESCRADVGARQFVMRDQTLRESRLGNRRPLLCHLSLAMVRARRSLGPIETPLRALANELGGLSILLTWRLGRDALPH